MRTKTKYIHVNQHVIRANKKRNKNDPCITIKQGSKNTYCHEVEVLGPNTDHDISVTLGIASIITIHGTGM